MVTFDAPCFGATIKDIGMDYIKYEDHIEILNADGLYGKVLSEKKTNN